MAKSKTVAETEATTSEIRDIDFSAIAKQRFRIDGDNNKIIELNTSDAGLVSRLEKAEQKLIKLSKKADEYDKVEITEDNIEEALADLASKLNEIDNEMRELVDFIFDSPISNIIVDSGTMCDPIGGKLRYEHIIDTLLSLYESDLKREANAISQKARMRANKYTGK